MADRDKRRLERQFAALSRRFPVLAPMLPVVRGRPGIVLRVPLGLFFIAGGLLFVLPFFGLWMVPLGIMILAVDLPILQPAVSAAIIRLRRRWVSRRKNGRN
jgi:hypothetical protein